MTTTPFNHAVKVIYCWIIYMLVMSNVIAQSDTEKKHDQPVNTASTYLSEMLSDLSSAGSYQDSCNAYADIGFLYKMLGQYDTALLYSDSALILSESRGYDVGQARAHEHLSTIYYGMGDMNKSMYHARRDIEICSKSDTLSLASGLYNLGIAQLEHGLLTSALDTLNIAKALFKEEGSSANVAGCFTLLSVIQTHLEHDEEAIEMQKKGIDVFKELPRTRALVQAYCTGADMFRTIGRYEEAASYLKEAKSYADRHGFDVEGLVVTQRYGELLHDQEQYRTSIDTLELVRLAYLNQKRYKYLPRNNEFLSRSYQAIGNLTKAKEVAEEGLEYLENASRPQDKEFLLKQLAQINNILGNNEEAYTLSLQYQDLVDARQHDEQLKQTRELEARFRNKEQKVKLLEQENQLATQEAEIEKTKSRNKLFGIGLAASLLLITLSYFWYRQRMKNQRQAAKIELNQALIESTEEERERIAQELHDGTGSLLTGIKLSLDKMRSDSNDKGIADDLELAVQRVQEVSKEVRRVSHAMAPSAIGRLSFKDVLTDMISTFEQIGTVDIVFNTSGDLDRLTKTERLMLYRILQECLNNSFKHSAATEIHISMIAEDVDLEMLYQDNGKGYDPNNSKTGLGLGSIEKRIRYLNGKRTIETEKGQGMLMIINFPIRPK